MNVVSALIPSGTPLGFVAILVVLTLLFLASRYVRWFSLSELKPPDDPETAELAPAWVG